VYARAKWSLRKIQGGFFGIENNNINKFVKLDLNKKGLIKSVISSRLFFIIALGPGVIIFAYSYIICSIIYITPFLSSLVPINLNYFL
jgi:hypothetical protein